VFGECVWPVLTSFYSCVELWLRPVDACVDVVLQLCRAVAEASFMLALLDEA